MILFTVASTVSVLTAVAVIVGAVLTIRDVLVGVNP
jgi:hypothetical protein